MKKLLILLCFIPISLLSQNNAIRGSVVDEQGNPLPYCNVVCKSLPDSSLFAYNITNDNGEFTIEVQSNSIVQISFIGFKTWVCSPDTIDISGEIKDMGRITMADDNNFLQEIDVIGELTTTTANETVVLLDGTNISQGRNGLEIISVLPGIRFDQRNGLKINGKDGCKVMLNGRILEMEDQELYRYLSQIRGETIQSVTIDRHAGAGFDSSVNGIINIRTKRNVNSSLNLMAGLDTRFCKDGYLGINPDLFFSTQQKGWNIYGGFSFSNIALNNTDTEETQYFIENYSDMKTSALLEKRQKNDIFSGRVGAVYEWNDNLIGLELDGSYTDKNRREDTYTDIIGDPTSKYDYTHSIYKMPDSIKNVNASAFYQFISDDKGSYLKFSNDLYWHKTNSSETTDILDRQEVIIDSLSTKGTQNMNRLTWVSKIDRRKVMNNNHQITYGIKYIYTDMDNDILYQKFQNELWTDDTENTHITQYRERVAATYIDYSASFNKFTVEAGIRYEQTWENNQYADKQDDNTETESTIYGNILPSLLLTYTMGEKSQHSLSFSFRSGVHRPTFADLSPYMTRINQFTVVAGNPDLSPTYSYSTILGISLAEKYYIGLTADIFKDKIEWTAYPYYDDILSALYRTINIPQVESYQLVSTIPINFFRWWSCNIDVSAGYKRDKYEVGSESIWQYYGRMNNLFKFDKLFNIELNGSYLSKDIFGNEIMNPYYTVDVSIKRTFFDGKLQLSLYGNNIFQKGLDVEITTDVFYKNLIMKDSRVCQNYGIGIRYIFDGKVNVKTVDNGNKADRDR